MEGGTHRRKWWRSGEAWRSIGGVIAVVMVGYTVWRQGEITDCQAEFNVAYTAALAERTQAAASEREAQRDMLDVILDPASTPQTRAVALVAWRTSLVNTDKTRADNPLPKDPRCN